MNKDELLKRIEKKKTEILKAEKLLIKYNKKAETEKDEWDLKYILDDIKRVELKIRDYKETLKKYELQVEKIDKENNKTRIEVIENLLDFWEQQNIEFFKTDFKNLNKYLKEIKEKENIIKSKYDFKNRKEMEKELKENNVDYFSKQENIKSFFNSLTISLLDYRENWEKKLSEIILKEKNNKRIDLINRVEEIVGNIIDASNLTITNGDINGFIIGDNGKCKVNTVGAGGYNIQRYHYRVLVKKIK